MNNELLEQATALAARWYNILWEEDKLSTGEKVYFAFHPELPGCKAQGNSIDEAKTNLGDARVDYIYALLKMGLPVPDPLSLTAVSNVVTKTYVFDASSSEGKR